MTIDLVPVSTTPKPTTSEVCFASPALHMTYFYSDPKLALRPLGCFRDPGSNMRRHSVSTPFRMAHLSHLREESTANPLKCWSCFVTSHQTLGVLLPGKTATCRNKLRKVSRQRNANVLLAGAYIWNMT